MTQRRSVPKLAFLFAICVFGLLAGCGAQVHRVERARVRFLVEPPASRVYVEDRFIASAALLARRPHAFTPGLRHFTITADGYFPHDLEIDLPSGLTTVRIRLRAVPR